MIKSIQVTSFRGETMILELANPEKSGFAILDITGLGPVKADINTTENGINDGAVFNSAHVSYRNIVLTLLFIGTDIETLRQTSYQYFATKQNIHLLIETDNRVMNIDGYVESNDPTIFSKTEGCKISIICPYPYFKIGRGDPNTTVFSGHDPAFTFPFSNESLTEKKLIFGYLRKDTYGNVQYNGDAGVGITILITALGAAKNIKIYNSLTKEKMILNTDLIETITGVAFGAGDEIIISTVKNKKSIRLLRNGAYTDIFRCLDLSSDWFTIYYGDNVFSYTSDTGVDNLQFTIMNDVIYEGI